MKKKLLQYYRLCRFHNPTGGFLLTIPSFWIIAMHYSQISAFYLIYLCIIFFVGSMLMRAWGCIINDMADIDLDKQIPRTQIRPLASGEVSKKEATILMALLLIVPAIIFFSFNDFAKFIALSSLIVVIIYPFTKRFFHAPQLVLGISFSWGVLLVDAVINNSISLNTIIVYIASIIWVVAYDTVYAYQDYIYDKKLGMKSTAVLIGDNPRNTILCLYLIMFSIMIFSNINIFIASLSYIYIMYKAYKLNYFNKEQCFDFFKSNVKFGILLIFAFVLS